MNTNKKFLAVALGALALVSSAAYAQHEGDYPQVKPFQSSRTRAEVRAEAVQAAYDPVNGEIGALVQPAPRSTLARAEVKAQAVVAAHHPANGEVGERVQVAARSTLTRAEVKQATVQAARAGQLYWGEVSF